MFRYNLSCFPICSLVLRSFYFSFHKPSSVSSLPDHFTSSLLCSNNLDIDECSNGIHDCNKNATCMNTAGHFNCTCNAGYSGDGHLCSGIICCLVFQDTFVFRFFFCYFYNGSPVSFLPDHFTSPLLYSNNLDIDECNKGIHNCNGNVICMNTAGHINCT